MPSLLSWSSLTDRNRSEKGLDHTYIEGDISIKEKASQGNPSEAFLYKIFGNIINKLYFCSL